MKAVILLVILSLGLASGETSWCTCAPFVSFEHTEIMVYNSYETTLDDCKNKEKCNKDCNEYFGANTNDGDLWHFVNGATVGQHLCNYVFQNDLMPVLMHKMVYGYYQVCGGAWQYTELSSNEALCCELGNQKHCTEL
ncbi:hypothetical protein T11_4388 [Trichinella zimbabwensis]|uniref:Uncharacterized protein n=1 Tax=Trichinella zimbabwensis TaxID=268475 RepID=A0A0V1GFA9_9BILA|nr:hypothetical protein T11_4388 [Trichinella zimbabwensis]